MSFLKVCFDTLLKALGKDRKSLQINLIYSKKAIGDESELVTEKLALSCECSTKLENCEKN